MNERLQELARQIIDAAGRIVAARRDRERRDRVLARANEILALASSTNPGAQPDPPGVPLDNERIQELANQIIDAARRMRVGRKDRARRGRILTRAAEIREMASQPDPGPEPGPPSLAILNLNDGDQVRGVMMIEVETSETTEAVHLYVDGMSQGFAAPPLPSLEWDTTALRNDLPEPDHPIRFCYWFANSSMEGDGVYHERGDEVAAMTNMHVILPHTCARQSDAAATPDQELQWFREGLSLELAYAASRGWPVLLLVNDRSGSSSGADVPIWRQTLEVAQHHWAGIDWLEIKHEPGWDRAMASLKIAALRRELDARDLPHKPIGYTFSATRGVDPDVVKAEGLEWVGIEAYEPPAGLADSAGSVRRITEKLVQRSMGYCRADQKILLIPQAYDRNGLWAKVDHLKDLQDICYRLGHADPRVFAITPFSYNRSGGSRDHPELQIPHLLAAERIFGVNLLNGRCPDALYTVTLVATGQDGTTVSATRRVRTDNGISVPMPVVRLDELAGE